MAAGGGPAAAAGGEATTSVGGDPGMEEGGQVGDGQWRRRLMAASGGPAAAAGGGATTSAGGDPGMEECGQVGDGDAKAGMGRPGRPRRVGRRRDVTAPMWSELLRSQLRQAMAQNWSKLR